MPARDISDIAEDMIDTLLEEGFGLEGSCNAAELAITEYLMPMHLNIMGDDPRANDDPRASAANAADIVITRIRAQKESRIIQAPRLEPTPKEPEVPPPTRFERDDVI